MGTPRKLVSRSYSKFSLLVIICTFAKYIPTARRMVANSDRFMVGDMMPKMVTSRLYEPVSILV